jgi:hypothetical protein
MYLFLLVFGVVLSVAGVVLAASGLSVHDRTFDPTLVTPGIVAVAGGLLLIGFGFALRVLQRIEKALAVRPAALRTAHAGEAVEAAATTPMATTAVAAPPSEPTRLPFPVKITRLPQTAAVPAPAPFAPAAEKRTEDLPQKFPKVARVGPAPAIEDEDIELSPRTLAPASLNGGEESAEQNVGPFVPRAAKARNGLAPAAKISTRFDAGARAPLTVERPKGPAFDALWPKGARPARAAAQAKPREEVMEAPAIPVAAPDRMIAEEAVDPSSAVSPAVAPDEAPEPITILKSGVVDGMAYTLYSDGSIEAQLPQGMLRFGSIAELRAHIEHDSQS